MSISAIGAGELQLIADRNPTFAAVLSWSVDWYRTDYFPSTVLRSAQVFPPSPAILPQQFLLGNG